MGLLDKLKQSRAERDLAEWAQREAQLAAWLQESLNVDCWTSEGFDGPLMLKPGERAFATVENSALIEPRRMPGQWVGRSTGVSFRVMKGVTYRVGRSRGTYQQGAEKPTAIDTGTTTITDQRVVFQGPKATREWLYSKFIGFQHDPEVGWTAIQVSNRQKVSGFLYGPNAAPHVEFRFELALAYFQGSVKEFQAEARAALAEHVATRPVALPPG